MRTPLLTIVLILGVHATSFARARGRGDFSSDLKLISGGYKPEDPNFDASRFSAALDRLRAAAPTHLSELKAGLLQGKTLPEKFYCGHLIGSVQTNAALDMLVAASRTTNVQTRSGVIEGLTTQAYNQHQTAAGPRIRVATERLMAQHQWRDEYRLNHILFMLKDPASVPALGKELSRYSAGNAVGLEAAKALAAIGTPEAKAALQKEDARLKDALATLNSLMRP